MRPKFIIALTLLAVLLFGAIYFLRPEAGRPPATPNEGTLATPTPATPAVATAPAPKTAPAETAPATVKAAVETALAPAENVSLGAAPAPVPLAIVTTNVVLTAAERQTLIGRLQDWEMNDDKQSLDNIVAQLTSPDQEVREAAIEATKQFGSRDAIPALKAAAARTENIDDKIAMLEAIKFLGVPLLGSPETQPGADDKNDSPPPQDSPNDPAP